MKKLLTILLISIVSLNKAQTVELDAIPIYFDIQLDSKSIETSSVIIGINTPNYNVNITNSFLTYLNPNQQYNFYITHPGYNTNTFYVTTNDFTSCPIIINLSSTKPDLNLGHYIFDDKTKTYKLVKD
jgi:hypothetical protein